MPKKIKKARAGRPTKYKKEFCALVIELGKEGVSRAGWAAQIDIAIATLYNWEEQQPEFLVATTRARDLSLAWWNKQGRKGIWSREFNAPAYRLQVMNRFSKDWRDKQEHEHSGKEGGAPIAMAITRTVVDPNADS